MIDQDVRIRRANGTAGHHGPALAAIVPTSRTLTRSPVDRRTLPSGMIRFAITRESTPVSVQHTLTLSLKRYVPSTSPHDHQPTVRSPS